MHRQAASQPASQPLFSTESTLYHYCIGSLLTFYVRYEKTEENWLPSSHRSPPNPPMPPPHPPFLPQCFHRSRDPFPILLNPRCPDGSPMYRTVRDQASDMTMHRQSPAFTASCCRSRRRSVVVSALAVPGQNQPRWHLVSVRLGTVHHRWLPNRCRRWLKTRHPMAAMVGDGLQSVGGVPRVRIHSHLVDSACIDSASNISQSANLSTLGLLVIRGN